MTPTQRAAAERLGADQSSSNLEWSRQVVALLRELAAEPMQEPAIWIQSNHLQHAKNGPYLARTGPTKLMSDFIPLYAAPQQRKPLTDEQIDRLDTQAIHGGPDSQYAFRFARAVEKAHGITGGKE